MKTTKDNYYNALLMCVDKNKQGWEWMHTPFEVDNFACATNARLMLFFDKELVKGLKLDKTPRSKVMQVVPKTMEKNFKIKVSLIEAAISKTPLIEEVIETETECKECDGEGDVICDCCGFEHICEKCDGEGYIHTSESTGKLIPDVLSVIRIGNSTFSVKKLLKLIEIAKELSQESITLIYQKSPRNASFFKIGEATLVLMPWDSEKEPIFTIK